MREKTCYALVLYTYDDYEYFYEWEEVLAVSFDADALKEEYNKERRPFALVSYDKHKELAGVYRNHWTIKEVEFLEKIGA